MLDTDFKEYRNEIPYNTINTWGNSLIKELPWDFVGWTGEFKEPYRHWASYPKLEGTVLAIWESINSILIEDNIYLKPERVIANLFNHGDSSWIHKDCDSDNSYTVIIYLNSFWDINWGGETVLVENNEVIKSFSPTPGKIIIFKSNILHGSRPVSREAPYPRFGLVFQSVNNISGFSQSKISSISTSRL